MSVPPSEIQKTSSLIKGAEGVAVFITIILVVIGALLVWQYTVKEKAGFANESERALWISLVVLSVLGWFFAIVYWAIYGAQNTEIGTIRKWAGLA